MGRISQVLVKRPLDGAGRSIVRMINSPMGAIGASTTGAITGIFVADAVAKDGLGSGNALTSIGLNAVGGAFLLGVGSVYRKPYFTSAGKVALGATAAGAAVGTLGHGASITPDIQVSFGPGGR